jgi:hypothetical protein
MAVSGGGCSDDSEVERFFSGVFCFSADFMDGEVMMRFCAY